MAFNGGLTRSMRDADVELLRSSYLPPPTFVEGFHDGVKFHHTRGEEDAQMEGNGEGGKEGKGGGGEENGGAGGDRKRN